jgi:hypothetical protein
VNQRTLAALAAATVLAATGPALAGNASPARIDLAASHVVLGDLGPATGDPYAVAARVLRAYAPRLHVDASRFRFDTLRHSLIGTHVRGAEVRGGVPVDGTAALVSLVEGRVIQVEAYGAGHVTGAPVAHPVSQATAVASALRFVGVTTPLLAPRVTRTLVPVNGTLVDTWHVPVVALKPATSGTVDVSAATGRALRFRDDNKYVDGSATVFDPNPVVTSHNTKLREPGVDQNLVAAQVDTDLDSPELTAQLKTLPLKELDAASLAAGRLSGPWVNVYGPTLPSVDGKFTFTRGMPGFEATMGYAHLDRLQRYIQSLGFDPKHERGVNAESQDIITTRVEGFDNSLYNPGEDVIVYGTGGVDDAEDAEVIVHEYGHAIQDAQVKGWGATAEGGAMGEAWGDFLSASYYARTSHGFGDACIAEWDSTSYSSSNPPCLRRTDSKKKYPDDMQDEVHADGEMWSALLWRLRSSLPGNAVQKSDNVIRLVITSHELLTPQAQFGDGVAALRTAAKALKHPEWAALVNKAAAPGHMPLNPE